jgi:hypothetical protein
VLHDAPSASGGLESWLDLVALNLFVLEVLTGETIKPRADSRALAELAAALSVRGDEVSQVIARMLGDSPYGTVAEFEQAMASNFPEFDRKPLVGRVQAEFDVFISYDSDDSAVARALDEQLTRHGVVPYFDRRDAFPDRWWNPILRALNRSRGFAILIGDTYRPHGHQHQEVQVARPAAQKDRLPFHVLLLGANEPKEFKQEFRHDPVYRVGRDVEAMAAHIIKSFQHPIAPLRDTGAARSASGTWPPSKTPQDMIIGPEPQLGLQQSTAVAPPAKLDADDAAAERPPA